MILRHGEHIDSRCSRASCHNSADFTINWRNPKIHAVDRVKVWLACEEHRDYLAGFLEARDFPVEVAPFVAVKADQSTAARLSGDGFPAVARE